MSKKRILLHVGTHKTGSTTLQSTMYRNREALEKVGVSYLGTQGTYPHLYSAFMNRPLDFVWNQHSGLGEAQIRARDLGVKQALRTELSQATGDTIILSSEFLSKLERNELKALYGFLSDYGSVHVVYFYRELLSWISSDSQQLAKAGLRSRPTAFATGMERLYEYPIKIHDVFAKTGCTFIRFEDAIETGICNTFLARFDLPTLASLGLKEQRLNESISGNAVQAMYLYNHLFPRGSETRNVREVKRLCQLPGDKYQVLGLRPKQIEEYRLKRDEVTKTLGLKLSAADELPKSQSLDPLSAETLKMVDRYTAKHLANSAKGWRYWRSLIWRAR